MGAISDAVNAFGKSITEGSKDIKGLNQSELRKYKSFLDSLTAEQKAAEQSKVKGMGQIARNKFVRRRIQNFSSATTKEVKAMGGQEKEGALAKGGKVRDNYAPGGSVWRGRKANYKI